MTHAALIAACMEYAAANHEYADPKASALEVANLKYERFFTTMRANTYLRERKNAAEEKMRRAAVEAWKATQRQTPAEPAWRSPPIR